MVERFAAFGEYVREYELERAEGLLLRYLSDVYKVLVQTVPEGDKTPAVDELVVFFGAIVRQVDSSLLDEWERMRRGDTDPIEPGDATIALEPEGSKDVTRDEKGFTVLVRNELYVLIRAIARHDWEEAARIASAGGEWTAPKLEAAFAPFFAEHAKLRIDPEARSPTHLRLDRGEWQWDFSQTLVDVDEANDWAIAGTIDLEGSRLAGKPIVVVKRIVSP
ncbi:hypothetical protein BH09MYX1_BH09MYX1_06930 [soil metagenome]